MIYYQLKKLFHCTPNMTILFKISGSCFGGPLAAPRGTATGQCFSDRSSRGLHIIYEYTFNSCILCVINLTSNKISFTGTINKLLKKYILVPYRPLYFLEYIRLTVNQSATHWSAPRIRDFYAQILK